MLSAKAIKKKQIILALSGFAAFVGVMVAGMWLSDPNRGKPSPLEVRKEEAQEVMKNYSTNQAVSAKESWISQSEKEITSFKQQNQVLKRQVDELMKRLEKIEGTSRKGGDMVPASSSVPGLGDKGSKLPPPPQDASILQKIANNSLPPAPSGFSGSGQGQKVKEVSAIHMISLSDETEERKRKRKSFKNISHYLPAGSFATAILLSGLDAPTGGLAKKSPMPIVLRLKDHGQLPNYFKSEISDCQVTGAGYGEISSERAHIRLEKLACVLADGDVVEVEITGFVAGEDGKAGLRGKVVSKQGALIAKAALAGTVSGIGKAVNQTHQTIQQSALGTVTTYDPKRIGEAGLVGGGTTAMDKIADYYMARANETYPIIEIAAGRIGEIVLLNGIDLGVDILGAMGRGDDYE